MLPAIETQEEGRFCPGCGYNLHGISSDRCPECGLDVRGFTGTSIPWENRRQIGRIKAFWRTCVLAAFRPKRLAAAAFGSVDISAARRFRWLIVAIASLACAGGFAIVLWQRGVASLNLVDVNMRSAIDSRWEASVQWSAGATLVPALPIGAVLAFVLGTWLPILWTGGLPPVRRQRVCALLGYALAALMLSPLCAALWVGQILWGGDEQLANQYPGWMLLLEVLAWATTALIVALCWWSAGRILAVSTHSGPGRSIAVMATVPVGWIFAGAIGLVLWPCLVGLVWIAIDSLR